MAMSNLTMKSTAVLTSGYAIPLLGFGVFQNHTTKASVLEAFRAGYRHVDSAQYYRNEAEVGAAVRESGLDRGGVFVTSKIMSSSARDYAGTLKGVDSSLRRFGFDYIDLFLIHDPYGGARGRIEMYRALEDARKAGKIRSVGVSNFGVKHLDQIHQAGYEMPTVNQIELHPFCQQRPIVAYCRQHNIAVEAYCPILQGKMDHPVIKRVAAKHDREPAQILIRWSLQKGFIPLPKSATPSRIHSNSHVYDFMLDQNDMQTLDALDQGAKGALSWNPVDVP